MTSPGGLYVPEPRSFPGSSASGSVSLKPKITRTNSVFPGASASGSARTSGPADLHFVATPRHADPAKYVPPGYEFVRTTVGGILVRRKPSASGPGAAGRPSSAAPTAGPGDFFGGFIEDQVPGASADGRPAPGQQSRVGKRITGEFASLNGVTTPTAESGYKPSEQEQQRSDQIASATTSIYSGLNLEDIPDLPFIFNYGAVPTFTPNPKSPDGLDYSVTGVLESRGVYGSADTLEHYNPPGTTVDVGKQANQVTISAASVWLRKLAATDKDAYNQLVVLLRNAGYLSGDDSELPLNGWTFTVAKQFATAAFDLANANAGGDTRDLYTYLKDRGQGYADLQAQKEKEQNPPFQPTERRYEDPATLAAAAKSAAIDALGRKLTPQEEARFEAAFKAQYDAAYDQIDAVGRRQHDNPDQSIPGARVTFPDIQGQTDAFLNQDEFVPEHQARLMGQYVQSFLDLIGRPS
jgi:hypothetical protein